METLLIKKGYHLESCDQQSAQVPEVMPASPKYGRLTLIEICLKLGTQRTAWKCLCDCGNIVILSPHPVKTGRTKSCGCFYKDRRKEVARTHGLTYSKEYQVWGGMVNRCTNQSQKCYKHYGGRGITVCERWKKFENFYEDMGKRPSDKHTLERIDNDKGYS